MIHKNKFFTVAGRHCILLATLLCPAPSGLAQSRASESTGLSQPGALLIHPSPTAFEGSVPTGKATETTLPLSLKEAIERALKYNLGVLESEHSARLTRATRLRNLNNLLPDVSVHVLSSVQQIDLASFGLRGFPGVPNIVGPFGFVDARASLEQTAFNFSDIKNYQASSESVKASQYDYQNSRDLVVQAAANAYLLVLSDAALVDAIRAQRETAQALHQRSIDQHHAGVIPAINMLRAQVELQTQQQRLIAVENQLAIDKLRLARVIGFPAGQDFSLTDAVPFTELASLSLADALGRAYATRPDYRSAQTQVRSAELAKDGARAEKYPSLSLRTDYGDIGTNFGSSHGTFTLVGTLNIPIFQGTRVRAAVLQADANLNLLRSELGDLQGKIDYQVRTAFLNLKSARDLVAASKSNVELASQTLGQAQDRFAAGVADNLEVVQAQESVAAANQSYIASVYTYNAAKVSLAQAMGTAEQSALQYLGGNEAPGRTPATPTPAPAGPGRPKRSGIRIPREQEH